MNYVFEAIAVLVIIVAVGNTWFACRGELSFFGYFFKRSNVTDKDEFLFIILCAILLVLFVFAVFPFLDDVTQRQITTP